MEVKQIISNKSAIDKSSVFPIEMLITIENKDELAFLYHRIRPHTGWGSVVGVEETYTSEKFPYNQGNVADDKYFGLINILAHDNCKEGE